MEGYVEMGFLQSLSYSACKEIFLPVTCNIISNKMHEV